MESLVTQNVMHASLCHMTSAGASGAQGSREDRVGGWERGQGGTGGWDRWAGQVGGTEVIGRTGKWDRGDRGRGGQGDRWAG